MLPCAMHVAGAMQVVHHLKNPISDDILRVIGMDVAHLHWSKMTSLGRPGFFKTMECCHFMRRTGPKTSYLVKIFPYNFQDWQKINFFHVFENDCDMYHRTLFHHSVTSS